MPDFVIVNGERVQFPPDTENDPAAKAAFLAKLAAKKPAKKEE